METTIQPPTEMCVCGKPLHYSDPKNEAIVRSLIQQHGETLEVKVLNIGTWRVPRHFIALHGIKAVELPELAAKYGFKKVA